MGYPPAHSKPQANQRHGEGKFFYTNGDTYSGEFARDVRNGHGTFTRAEDGLVYTGRWRRDQEDGEGELVWVDGRRSRPRARGRGRGVRKRSDALLVCVAA